MANQIHISKFSTLNFEPENIKSWEDQVRYCQKIGISDPIYIQFVAEKTNTYSYGIINSLGTIVKSGLFAITSIDSAYNVLEVEIKDLPIAIYQLQIYDTTSGNLLVAQSSTFGIIEDVSNSVLLTYTNKTNDFDTVFISTSVRIFNLRIEGGIMNDGKQYLVEGSSFRNQYQEMQQLFQMPYKTSIFTIGSAFGVPDWVAEKINLIFCLTNVYIDYQKYVRSEKSVPERALIEEGYPFSNFKLVVESQAQFFTTTEQLFTAEWIRNNSFLKDNFTFDNDVYVLPVGTNSETTLSVQYVGVGGQSAFALTELVGAAIIQITREMTPLSTSQYNFNTATGTITLVGSPLSLGETCYIIYSV